MAEQWELDSIRQMTDNGFFNEIEWKEYKNLWVGIYREGRFDIGYFIHKDANVYILTDEENETICIYKTLESAKHAANVHYKKMVIK